MTVSHKALTLQIKGMDCAGCAKTIETGVSQLDGVEQCSLNFTTEKLSATGNISAEMIINRVRELGFDVAEPDSAEQTSSEKPPRFWAFMQQRSETRLVLLALLLIIPGLLLEEILGYAHPLIEVASLLALMIAGWPIAHSAWQAVRINREININVLMTIAAIGAVIIGEYTEAGMVMVLFAFGEALEGFTGQRARAAIRSLMKVAPQTATRLEIVDQAIREVSVAIDALQIGDHIVVKPGERIPMDGQVITGVSAVNQAAITGESRLITKERGATVFAGTVNGEGALEVEVTHLAADNTISRVIKLVEAAQENQAPAQRFIDRFAQIYTPLVVVAAILTIVIPTVFFGQPLLNGSDGSFGWLYRGLALLIVACPCALVISTPVSIISAISNAARNGVLIKGGVYLEQLSRVKAIAFDKTGTLTQGTPAVVNIRTAACQTTHAMVTLPADLADCEACDHLVALAEAVERRSEHPFARAIEQEAQRRGVNHRYPAAQMVQTLTGRGVSGTVADQEVIIGSHAFFEETLAHPEDHCLAATAAAEQGYTTVMVGQAQDYLGTIAISDTVRTSSQSAIAQLKQLGFKTLVMLTGDNDHVAQKIAAQIGITAVKANLLPEDKLTAVQELQAEHGVVAMVGDGINDAPALAAADVGIAMGAAGGGTAQALETADISLMQSNLNKLPFVMQLSRMTQRTIWTNVAFSLGIKFLFLLLVLFGLGTMWMAVLADVGTSLLVTLYGMRLLHWRGLQAEPN